MSGRFRYGVRLEVQLKQNHDERVSYEGFAKFPDESQAGFQIDANYEGQLVQLDPLPTSTEVPEWVVKHLEKWVITVFRQAAKRNRWPRRLELWKGPPDRDD